MAVKRGRSRSPLTRNSLVSPPRPLPFPVGAPLSGPRQPWQLLWRPPGLYPLARSAQPVGAHEVRRQLRGRSGLRSARASAPRDPQLSLFPLRSRSGVDPAVLRSRRFCLVPSGRRVLAPGLRLPGPRAVRLVSLSLCGCVLSGGGCPGLGNPRAGLPRTGPGLPGVRRSARKPRRPGDLASGSPPRLALPRSTGEARLARSSSAGAVVLPRRDVLF